MSTFFWYDYETFGIRPAIDWPAQFAGIRTDENFNEIEAPVNILCQLPEDKLPQIEACLVNHLTPKTVQSGLIESEFIQEVNRHFSQPNTCVVGYNNLNFDDEVTRFSLYRNFLDPYAREWKQGNSRWDLIDVIRLCYALRPETLNWPTHASGVVSFKLDQLTQVNDIRHEAAHTAISDVRATIALAKLIAVKQPDLMQYLLKNKDKHAVSQLLDLNKKKPVLYISSYISPEKFCLALIVPLTVHPSFSNQIIACDLSVDPASWIQDSALEMKQRLLTKRAVLEDQGLKRLPVFSIRLNRCPVLVSWKALRPQDIKRLNLDQTTLEKNYEHIIQNLDQVSAKLKSVFESSDREETSSMPSDQMLYSGGFFSREDRNLIEKISHATPDELNGSLFDFRDARLHSLLFLYRARNWPEKLSQTEKEKWLKLCQEQLCLPFKKEAMSPLKQFRQDLEALMNKTSSDDKDYWVLSQLMEYAQQKTTQLMPNPIVS